MIKKLIALVVFLAVLAGIWYFVISPSGDECTVSLTTGEQKTMSVRELRKIYAKDAYNWSNYGGCKVTGEGKITKVEAGCDDFKSELPYDKVYYTVSVGNGVKLLVTADQMDGFAQGDEVFYTGKLTSGNGKLHVYVLAYEEDPAMVHLN